MSTELSPTILLIEDEDDDVFIMQRALRLGQIGNPLQVVRDGQQALDYLSGTGVYANRAQYPLPFLIFLDLKLPYVSGFEVLSWMRQQPALAGIVVVVLSGSAEARDQERTYALGARSYLVKPPTAKVLLEVLAAFKGAGPATHSASPLLPAATAERQTGPLPRGDNLARNGGSEIG